MGLYNIHFYDWTWRWFVFIIIITCTAKKMAAFFFWPGFFFIFFFYIIDIALEFLFLLALFFLKGSWLDDGQGVRVTSPAGAYRVIVMMDDGKGSLGWIGLGWVGLGHVEMRYLDVYG